MRACIVTEEGFFVWLQGCNVIFQYCSVPLQGCDVIFDRQEAHALYIRHLSLIRLDLDPQSEYWDVLQLKGVRKQTISGWLGQVTTFYDNMGRVQDILNKHNITPEEIAQAQAMLAAIAAFRVRQSQGKSEKQQASQQRQEAVKKLQRWMRDFLYIARHALKDDKQQLEALGQVV